MLARLALLVLLAARACVMDHPPASPCPRIFSYRRWLGRTVGLVTVTPRQGGRLNVEVALSLAGGVSMRDTGAMHLLADERAPASLLRGPLHYIIKFPFYAAPPAVARVLVNGVLVCHDPHFTESSVQSVLVFHHTLLMLGSRAAPHLLAPLRLADYEDDDTLVPPRHLADLASYEDEDYTQEYATLEEPDVNCGRRPKPRLLLLRGERTARGDWPWVAVLFRKSGDDPEFQCGATLVSTRHLVTAGHCVQPREKPPLLPEDLFVYLGKHNLRRVEPYTQTRDISRIVVHPNYGSIKYDFDLAVMVLKNPVLLTTYVQPVCLPPASSREPPPGMQGVVVGWGRNEMNQAVSAEPRVVLMPLVSQSECLRSNPDFRLLTSQHTFCAGARDGSGPCSGDSGNGMYLLRNLASGSSGGEHWTVRGIVSLSLQGKNRECDLSNYVVFTDLARFATWIRRVMRGNSF